MGNMALSIYILSRSCQWNYHGGWYLGCTCTQLCSFAIHVDSDTLLVKVKQCGTEQSDP